MITLAAVRGGIQENVLGSSHKTFEGNGALKVPTRVLNLCCIFNTILNV